jgi:DNA polymerase-3 subunit delta
MRLRSEEQLPGQLAKSLAPVYAIYGDEPLLVLEAADAVRAAARKHGFAEREVYEPGRGFDWSELRQAGASLSLFGDKKIVELRLASGKVGAPAAEAIVAWCARPSEETLLLITMPRPEGGGWWDAPWFLALNKVGVIVETQPLARAALPAWLEKRLARQKQSAAREVLEYLADRVEGNLLAAHQEVLKLGLLAPEGELALETVRAAVADVARFDTYVAAEALVAGDTARYLRVLEGLRG